MREQCSECSGYVYVFVLDCFCLFPFLTLLLDEENVVRLWALNQKTAALREKMHEKMRKYWQSQYDGDEYGEEGEERGEREEKRVTQPVRNKESAMDRYKGEITKLERSMKAVQHQRYNARR